MKDNNRVAVFIDAENISSKYADRIMEEASNYGDVIIKRVFADWSNQTVQPWKDVVSRHSLIPEQQFSAVKGKNSSDISLIINAMVVLYEKNIDVFCLASSDSDFTRLVQEMREHEKTVVGFGMKQTVQHFIKAFSEFVYVDENDEPIEKKSKKAASGVQPPILDKAKMSALGEIIDRIIENYGKAYYSLIQTEMKNKYSDFIPKNYGCKSMKDFMSRVLADSKKYMLAADSDNTSLYVTYKEEKKTK